jgi:hypothetical protein
LDAVPYIPRILATARLLAYSSLWPTLRILKNLPAGTSIYGNSI